MEDRTCRGDEGGVNGLSPRLEACAICALCDTLGPATDRGELIVLVASEGRRRLSIFA